MEWLGPLRERKSYLFLMGYESLFTMFPQLWINEKEGKKLEDQSRNYYQTTKLTLFEKKFKYFLYFF